MADRKRVPLAPTVLGMANDEEPPSESETVLDRLVAARIDAHRARAWLDSGLVRVDGVYVTDPDTPAAPPARVVLTAS